MKDYGIVAYYISGTNEGNELKPLYIENEHNNIDEIWELAVRNRNKFPVGQLVKIEIIPKCR